MKCPQQATGDPGEAESIFPPFEVGSSNSSWPPRTLRERGLVLEIVKQICNNIPLVSKGEGVVRKEDLSDRVCKFEPGNETSEEAP
jgi:hypothetical protein